jgi:PIN domain nuclease of toxin-antitoxin system
MPTQWILLTTLTLDEIRRELQPHIDPSDRLLITQVASMSYRNLICGVKFGRGAA